jgi:hypothetical protein
MEKKIRTIKVFDADAQVIEQIQRRSPANTTMADVVHDMIEFQYPSMLDTSEQSSEGYDAALKKDRDRRSNQ